MSPAAFNGGIKLLARYPSEIPELLQPPLPEEATVLMQQHLGEPCSLQVKKGALVQKGQILGQSSKTTIHSPVSGKITNVDTNFVLPSAKNTTAVSIESDSSAEQESLTLQAEDTLGLLIQAGIHDSGQVSRPLLEKIQLARTQQVHTLIISALDELLLRGSKIHLLARQGTEVEQGLKFLLRLTGAKQAVLAVYSPVLNQLEPEKWNQGYIKILPVPPRHPLNMDKLLLLAAAGQECPAEKTLEDFGYSVFSAETAYTLQQTASSKQPQLQKFLALDSPGLQGPKNMLVHIGTPLRQALEYAGLSLEDAGKVIVGGPLTGQAISNLDTPVTKDISQIMVLDREHIFQPSQEACIKCGYCVDVCPMRLMPFLLSGFSEGGYYDMAAKNDIFSCIECGCCAYVCPAKIPMVQWIQLGKSMLNAQRSQEHV
ncbi:MAG: RnfABCDGE type electron transport complex subunit C [Desulfohalobiaceae bacterium]